MFLWDAGAEREEPHTGGEPDAEQRGGQGLPGAGQAQVELVNTFNEACWIVGTGQDRTTKLDY